MATRTPSLRRGGTNITIDTDDKDTVNLGGTHTGLSVTTGNDDDTVNVSGAGLSGTIDVGAGAVVPSSSATVSYGPELESA